MPPTEAEKADSEKVKSSSSMERADNSKDESFVHLGRVLVNLMPEKEKTIFGHDHSATMQLYRLHQVPEYLHIKSSSSSLTRAKNDNGSGNLKNNVKWYTPWNWWRLFTSSSTNILSLPSTSEAASTTNNFINQTEEERMRMMEELDDMYDELNETYLSNPDLYHTNKENMKDSITDDYENKKSNDEQEKDNSKETLSKLADQKTRTSFASSMLEMEPIRKDKYLNEDSNNKEDVEKQHNKTNTTDAKEKPKVRRPLPEITIGPLTDQQVEDELTESVRNDRTQLLNAEEQIHTILSTIEKTRMRYLVPSTVLSCEEELNAVTKCYELFNARKRSELMANMNKTHHNIQNDNNISSNGGNNKDKTMSEKRQILTQAELLKCAPLAKSLRRCVDLTLSRYSSHDDTEEGDNLNNNIEKDGDGKKENSNTSKTNVNNKN